MDVFVPYLNKDTTAFRQQLPRHHKPIAQISEIAMDTVLPGIPERLHLLRLTRHTVGLAFLHIAAARARLPVAREANAVRRVQVDHLHLAAQPFLLRQAIHHQQAVAQDHPVRPVLGVLVELKSRCLIRDAVEAAEQICLWCGFLRGDALQIADQRLGIQLFLNVNRHSLNAQRRAVLLILPAPDQLRVQVRVAWIELGFSPRFLLRHQRRSLRSGDILARDIGGMDDRLHLGNHRCGCLFTVPPQSSLPPEPWSGVALVFVTFGSA